MKFTLSIFLVLVAAASQTLAAFTVWTPNSAWTAGSQATISWTNKGGSNPSTLTFTIMDGSTDTDNAAAVASLGSASFSAGSVTVNVPASLPAKSSYFIRAGSSTSDYMYTGFFSINGGSAASSSAATTKASTAATTKVTTAAATTAASTTSAAGSTTSATETASSSITDNTSSTETATSTSSDTTSQATPTETGESGAGFSNQVSTFIIAAGAVAGSYLLL